MALMMIRDNAIWAKHVEGDARLAKAILDAPEHAEIPLIIENVRVTFQKMRDGRDGRPTPGIKPSAGPAKDYWHELQSRRGEFVTIELDRGEVASAATEPSLGELSVFLAEWDSPEDSAAYDGL